MTTLQTMDSPPLPPAWKWVRLGDVAQVNPRRPKGLSHPSNLQTTFLPMSSVSAETGTVISPEVREFHEVSKGYTYFQENNVLFAKITPCMQNGKHAIARHLKNGFGFGSTEFHVIRTGDELAPEWIHRFLRQPHILDEATKHFRGAVGQQRVPKEFLSDLTVPLPPLSEQQHIVTNLNERMAAVERARKAAEARLEAAQALVHALLRAVFPTYGQALGTGWKWARLGDVCDSISTTDPRKQPDKKFTYIDISSIDRQTKSIVTPSVLSGKDAPSRARRIVRRGDVLVATTRPNLNAVALVGEELDGQVCSTGLCVLRPIPELLNPSWLLFATIHKDFVDSLSGAVTGAMYPAVSDKRVYEQEIPLPTLSEQKRIVAKLNDQLASADRASKAAEAQLAEVEALPSALVRAAFSGGI